MFKLLCTLSFALTTFASTSALAQTRYCIGGDLDHMSTGERAACSATMQAVRTAATTLRAPADWHFVVVCGEEGWRQYADFSTHDAEWVANAAADTDLAQRVTYLRSDRLQGAKPHSLQRIVGHEVAAILLKTEDEPAIQQQMAKWERDANVQLAQLQ